MKYVKLMVASLVMVSGVASAGAYSTFELSNEEKRSTNEDTLKYGLVVGVKVDGGMDYSIKVDSSQAKIGDGSISNGIEGRAKKTFAGLTSYDIKPYLGVRLGQKIKSDESFSHYAVDYGVKLPIMGNIVFLDLGGRQRNAFEQGNQFRSHRLHTMISWDITKQDTVAVRYSQAYGDLSEEKDAFRLSYTRNF